MGIFLNTILSCSHWLRDNLLWNIHRKTTDCEGRAELKILAIGFLPPPLGGVSVSFKIFCDIVRHMNNVSLSVINVSGIRQRNNMLRESCVVIMQLWREASRNDVVYLYCIANQIPSLGLASWAICRLRRKPLILRMGAGQDYREVGPMGWRIAEYVIRRVPLFLVQTKSLLEICRRRGITRIDWYPTNRPIPPFMVERTYCRHFVYIGQVRPLKGLRELFMASMEMPETVSVDVYGPLLDGMNANDLRKSKNIHYKGIIKPENVACIMREYDALVLPSKASTEGYPGAILEALSLGMPVISTTVGGISEVLNEQCSILIPPGDSKALANAMRRLVDDPLYYQILRQGALAVRSRFSAHYWAEWLVNESYKLSRRRLTSTAVFNICK